MSIRHAVVVVGFLLSASSAVGAQALPSSTPTLTIAGFSFQRAITDSEQGRTAFARVNAVRDQKSREVEERNKALAGRVEAFQRSLATLSDTSRTQQARDLDKFRLDTERFIQDAQAEFLGVQREAETAFLATLEPILGQIVKERGVQLLINLDDQERVLWSNPAIDITNDVVALLASQRK